MANLARDPVFGSPVKPLRVNQPWVAPNLNTSTLAPAVVVNPFVIQPTELVKAKYASQVIVYPNLLTTTLVPVIAGTPFKPQGFISAPIFKKVIQPTEFNNLLSNTLYNVSSLAPFINGPDFSPRAKVWVQNTNTPNLLETLLAVNGNTGTTNTTLGLLTLSSTATLDIPGATNLSLAALTLVSAGTLSITGLEGTTLGSLTLTSQATLDITGSLSQTLGVLTLFSRDQGASGTGPGSYSHFNVYRIIRKRYFD